MFLWRASSSESVNSSAHRRRSENSLSALSKQRTVRGPPDFADKLSATGNFPPFPRKLIPTAPKALFRPLCHPISSHCATLSFSIRQFSQELEGLSRALKRALFVCPNHKGLHAMRGEVHRRLQVWKPSVSTAGKRSRRGRK